MDKLSGRNVFFCYSQKDEELDEVEYLLNFFIDLDLNVLNLNERNELININEVSRTLYTDLSRGDYLIVVLTENSVNSKWMSHLLNDLELRYRFRDINIISLKMDDCLVPDLLFNEFFVEYNDSNGLEQLVNILRYSYYLDFKEFNYQTFENLIHDLLKSLGFKNLEREFPIKFSIDYYDYKDSTFINEKSYESPNFSPIINEYILKFDFKGEYPQKDPFGLIDETLWIIDVKFRRDRINPGFIKEIGRYVGKLPEKYKLAIITSGHLTSTSRYSIDKLQDNARIQIKVIDGPRLRKILIEYPLVIEKYFKGV